MQQIKKAPLTAKKAPLTAKKATVLHQLLIMEEERDSKQLYEVSEMHDEYDGEHKDDFPHRPIANLQIHDTISSTGKCSLYILLGIQVVIILILIILLGINGVTLTHLNTVEVCDNTGGSSTGASTGTVGSTSDSTAQLLNITQRILSYKDNDTMYALRNTDLLQVLGYNVSQLSQQLGSTDAKVDDIRNMGSDQMALFLNMSDYLYQVLQTTGDSAQKLVNIIGSLTNLKDTSTTAAAVVDDILVIVEELLTLQNASSLFNSITPVSCKDIKAVLPNSPTGYYHVNSRNIYCNMDTLCNGTGGWTRLAYLDMTDAAQSCPSGFRLYQTGGVRACGRPWGGPSFTSVKFPSNGIQYSQICGRVIGYQYKSTDALAGHFAGGHDDINSYYVDGVSITHGYPRQHVWTLVSSVSDTYSNHASLMCACAQGSTQSVQSFIGDHYFCESGNHNSYWSNVLYTSDPLWDGKGCGPKETVCCAAPGLPWFYRDFGTNSTTDYLELRVCGDQHTADEDNAVSFYEIYVK